MGWVGKFVKSSIGAKLLMAASGLAMVGFVLVHMLGNLQVYMGQEPYNAYAHFLKSTPELLWPARLGLLAAVSAHIASGMRLAALNRSARGVAYTDRRYRRASLTSRSMALSGLVVLSFIVYHLAHFTLGLTDPSHYHLVDAKGRHDVYSMFVYGFMNPYVAASYVVAMGLLGLHLSHGVSSMFQTLGINHPRIDPALKAVGPLFALAVVAGNVSMPIAVWLGVIQLPGAGA